jgi:hypothetical protein
MSALAAAYTQTFRPVVPLQGTVFDNGSDVLLGQMPLQTATLMAPLAQSGLNARAQLLNTQLVNRQRTLEQETEVAFRERERRDSRRETRRSTLADKLLQVASGVGRSGAQEWALGQVFAPQGDGLTRAGNRYGTGLAAFEGAQAGNAPILQTYLDAWKSSRGAGSGLPAPPVRN